jgi:MFS family permease
MISLAPAVAKRMPFYYGWVIMLTTGLASFSSIAFGPGIIGALIVPMSEEFGWSRSVAPGAILVGSLFIIILGPLAGRLVDKYGARPVMTTGAVIMAGCLLALGLTQTAVMFYAVYGLGFATFSSIGRVALGAITAQWFVRRRGIATSVSHASSGMGFVVLPIVGSLVMGIWDWRAAWVAMGTIAFVVAVIPSLLLLVASPDDVGQRVDGDRTDEEAARTSRTGRSAATEVQWTVREALKTTTFWMLLIALGVQGLAMNGANVHMVPRLVDQGISTNVAVLSFTIGGAVTTASGFLFGPLLDRIHLRYVFAIGGLSWVGFVLAILAASASTAWIVTLIGLFMGVGAAGTVLVMRVAIPNYFGRRSAGALQGLAAPVFLLASGSGGFVAGAMYESVGGYTAAFTLFIGLLGVSILIMLFMPTPVKRTQQAETETT